MSGKGGVVKSISKGFHDTVKDTWDHPLNAIVRGATNFLSLGTVQYNNGKWEEGALVHAGDEVIGELDGRNKARGALADANAEADAAAAAQRQLLANQQLQNYRSDVLQSRAAKAARDTAAARGAKPSTASFSSVLGGDQNDILGA